MIDKPNNKSSDKDLEQYGIWIKSEPQDIVEELEDVSFNQENNEDISLETFDELESQLDTLEFESESESAEVSTVHDDSIIDIPIDDILEEASPEVSKKQIEPVSKIASDISDLSIDEVSLDDFLDTDSSTEKDLESSTSIHADDFLQEEILQEPESEDEIEEIESIDLDLQFDDTIETPLDTLEEEFSTEDIEGFESLETVANEDIASFDTNEFSIEQSEQISSADEVIDVSSMFISEDSKTSSTKVPKSSQESVKETPQQKRTNLDAFIDNEASLPITELSIDNMTEENQEISLQKNSPSDISLNLLNQIAQELASIKNELASLKSQIQTARQHHEDDLVASTAQTEQKGFFEEEDDETIALTGDELDNILNTASFTVESTSSDDKEATIEPIVSESEEFIETLLPEDGNYGTSEKGIEIIDEEQNIQEIPEESGEISFNANEIVENLTPFTELQEDETALVQESALEPLEEIPLEEPDLSQINLPKTNEELLSTLGTTEEEPSINFSHPDETVLDRIVLSIDGNEQTMKTNDLAESIPEIEEIAEEPESIELLDEIPLNINNEEQLNSIHPDELKTQLDDSLFVSNQETITQDDQIKTSEINEVVTDETAPDVSNKLKTDIKTVLLYLDQLLAALPEEKIEEFAQSEYYNTYKKLFEELGII